jgi:release factor glutamine methyltransferase
LNMKPSVGELLAAGIKKLKSAGIEDAEISSRSILQKLLHKTPAQLQLAHTIEIADDLVREFYDLIDKRTGHYPLQYIIGEVEFYNIKMKVDERVLIPRPETEALVDFLIGKMKNQNPCEILDIGTGSGNIAISLAANLQNARVTATDISSVALELAKENAEINGVANKISFDQANCLDKSFWAGLPKFDVIVSNPPYVGQNQIDKLQPEIRDHEPLIAVVSEDDELKFFKLISANAGAALRSPGLICFEVGLGQSGEVSEILKATLPDIAIQVIDDLSGTARIVAGSLI